MNIVPTFAVAVLASLLSAGAHAIATTDVDFSSGTGGWSGPTGIGGATWVDTTLGQSAPSLHTVFEDFGVQFTNGTSAFAGDYSTSKSVTLSFDILANSIVFDNHQVARDVILELRDTKDAQGGYPWSSVWIKLGTLDAATTPGWQHLSVTIADTSSAALPTGWGGYGDEDAFANPILPTGQTFASILKNVDTVAISTLTPGYVYGFTDFDVAVDNIAIKTASAVPEPAPVALLAAGGLLVAGAAKRRRTPRMVAGERA